MITDIKKSPTDSSAYEEDLTICFLMNDFSRGGAERLVKDIAIQLDDFEGISPIVVVANDTGELKSEFVESGVRISSLGVGVSIATIPKGVSSLVKKLDDIDPDIVHSHLAFSHLISRIACTRLSIPHIATYHNRYDKRTSLKRVAERTFRRLSDEIICVSDGVRQSHPSNNGMHVIYNAIDVDSFRDRVANVDRTKSPIDTTSNTTVFLNVARCVWQKRQLDLIKAIDHLASYDVHLLIVGDGPERSSLEEEVAEKGLSDSVTVTGYVDSIVPYYAFADAFVSTSSSEGLPTTHIEAMAAGLPIISTNIPGVREIVTHGENGYLCPVGKPDRFAKAMSHLHTNDVNTLGDRGYEIAKSQFSIAEISNNHLNLYQKVMSD